MFLLHVNRRFDAIKVLHFVVVMRLFAIGDIQGCATALDTLVNAIHLQSGDRLVTLGDY